MRKAPERGRSVQVQVQSAEALGVHTGEARVEISGPLLKTPTFLIREADDSQ